jgi:D-inositol-3-phosphate glycosyltransferase
MNELPLVFRNAKGASPVRHGARRPFRVLMVTSQSSGGIWHYACSLSRALAAVGVNVALATPYPFERIEAVNGIVVWSLGTRSPDAAPLPAVRVNHFDKIKRFHRLVTNFRPDVVHLHDRFGKLDFVYFRVLKSLSVRVVCTAHEVRSTAGKSNWFDRARYRQADAVLVHSTNGVTDLLLDGVDESKIMRVPHANYLHFHNGPGLSSSRAKQLLGIPPNGRSILFFGFVAPYKGLSILIDALSKLHQEHPGLYLVIAGKPMEDFEPYKRQIARLGLQRHVIADLRYIPFDEFEKFFSAADVVALPYQRIYQSGVLQLAYAFGRPVVVTNVGGLGDTVTEDHTGLVASAADAQGVACAISELLSNPSGAEVLGGRARQLAETKYSWQTVAGKVIEVYCSLTRHRHPADALEVEQA